MDRGPVHVHRGRLRTVAAAIDGVLSEGRLALSALGRAVAVLLSLMEKHAIKRIDRLLGNRHLWSERMAYFAALAHAVVGDATEIVVLVDWTQVCGELHALAASIPLAGRSVTVYFEVHPKKLDGNRQVQFCFLEQLTHVLPFGRKVIVVADMGFGAHWFRQVRKLGWHYLGRLTRSVHVRCPGRKWSRADSLWRFARRRRAIDFAWCEVVHGRPLSTRLVLYKGKPKRRKGAKKKNPAGLHPSMAAYKKCQARNRNPWLLATSLDLPAEDLVAIYAERMQCEESFRDYKSRRFGFSLRDVRTDSARRATILLLIATLAHLLALLAGAAAESLRIAHTFQANTTRNRRVNSLQFLGRRVIRQVQHNRRLARRIFSYLTNPHGIGFLSEPSVLP